MNKATIIASNGNTKRINSYLMKKTFLTILIAFLTCSINTKANNNLLKTNNIEIKPYLNKIDINPITSNYKSVQNTSITNYKVKDYTKTKQIKQYGCVSIMVNLFNAVKFVSTFERNKNAEIRIKRKMYDANTDISVTYKFFF